MFFLKLSNKISLGNVFKNKTSFLKNPKIYLCLNKDRLHRTGMPSANEIRAFYKHFIFLKIGTNQLKLMIVYWCFAFLTGNSPKDGKDHVEFSKRFENFFNPELFKSAVDSKDLSVLWNPLNWNFKEFICGWGSAFINICVTYPLNKVTFRQMLNNMSPVTAIKEMSNEGIRVLYRGMLPPLCQKTTSLSLMFGVYEGTRIPLSVMLPPVPACILAALISGTTEATLAPFERIQTLLQDKKYQKEFMNTKHAFLTIQREYGYREFYRGLVPILLRNGPSNVFYFFLRDGAKERLKDKPYNWYGKMFAEFVCGGLIGGIISTLFYPLNVVKVYLQSRLGGEFQNLYSATVQIYNERGRKFGCFYRGVHLNYTRGFISWGVITVSSESIRRFIY